MNYKHYVGIIVLIVGVALFLFAQNTAARIAEAKEGIQTATSPLSSNPIGRAIGKSIESKASAYDDTVKMLKIGGIAFIVIGAGLVVFGFFHKKR